MEFVYIKCHSGLKYGMSDIIFFVFKIHL